MNNIFAIFLSVGLAGWSVLLSYKECVHFLILILLFTRNFSVGIATIQKRRTYGASIYTLNVWILCNKYLKISSQRIPYRTEPSLWPKCA